MAASRSDRFLGVRAAVGLTLLAGALSMVTGIVHM